MRAPITGTIIEKTVEPGIVITSPTNAVSGGSVLMKMADLTSVQVRTRVDETDIGKIQPGMLTRVTVAAYPNQPFEGEVLKIEPQAIVEQNVTMFAVLIKIANRGGLLKPGMNAEVRDPDRQSRRRAGRADRRAARRLPTCTLTAAMLGIDEADAAQGAVARRRTGGAAGKNMLSLGGREIELPAGVDAAKVTALMEKRRSGQELTAEERTLMRTVFQQAGGNFGGGGGGGGGGLPAAAGHPAVSRAVGLRAAVSSRPAAANPARGRRRRERPTISSAATTGSSRCAATRPCRWP